MKKFLLCLLSLICISGFIFGSATFINAVGEVQESGSLTADDLDLLLPGGYEQYLSLTDVKDISVKDGYIAIADGNRIYVYNGAEYRQYTAETAAAVRQLEWGENHVLFFKYESNPRLYTIDCSQDVLTEQLNDIRAENAFTLNGNDIYSAYCEIGKITVYKNGASYYELDTSGNPPAPPMVYADDRLYFMDGLYLHHTENRDFVCYLNGTSVYDIAIQGDTLYYTDGQTMRYYNLNTHEHLVYRAEGVAYTALSLDGNYLYVAGRVGERTKICRFDTAKEEFTDYEIATASSSENRLISATASIVSGNYLITADESRLSLYDYTAESYFCFPCAFTADYLASDGKSILIANDSAICAYNFEGTRLTDMPITGFNGNIMGVVCAKDGNYLLMTHTFNCYRIDADSFNVSSGYTKNMAVTVLAMSGDIYGNVYVEYANGAVYKYTETQFLSSDNGEPFYTFPAAAESISVDFDGNVYGILENTLYCSDGNSYSINADNCLFNATAALQDFAFGYEYNTVYFIYDDYILSTEALNLPNLNGLETGDAYETLFERNQNTDGVIPVVTLNEKAVLLHFSLDGLTENSSSFPYLTYSRVNAGVNAVVLGETEIHGLQYYIVTVFNPANRRYTAGLVLQNTCALIEESSYASNPEQFSNSAGYITNDVFLYKYPYMTETLTLASLDKNSVITVLKELSLGDTLIDYDYYYISYTDAKGTLYGYVPKNFVRNFIGTADQPNNAVYYKRLLTKKDITATSADNRLITLYAGTEYSVIAYLEEEENSDTVRIAYESEGVTYYANVAFEDLAENSTDPLRYFLIALLLVLDVILVTNYCIFRPNE